MNEQNLKPFKKGVKHEYNPEARQAKKQLRDLLRDFTEENYEKFTTEFKALRGKAACDVYLKALEFVRPRYASIPFEEIKEAQNALELLRGLAEYKKET